MDHADIQTTMRCAHHIPKVDAARRFTEAIEEVRADSRDNSPLAANSGS
jgi:hypothetical protein